MATYAPKKKKKKKKGKKKKKKKRKRHECDVLAQQAKTKTYFLVVVAEARREEKTTTTKTVNTYTRLVSFLFQHARLPQLTGFCLARVGHAGEPCQEKITNRNENREKEKEKEDRVSLAIRPDGGAAATAGTPWHSTPPVQPRHQPSTRPRHSVHRQPPPAARRPPPNPARCTRRHTCSLRTPPARPAPRAPPAAAAAGGAPRPFGLFLASPGLCRRPGDAGARARAPTQPQLAKVACAQPATRQATRASVVGSAIVRH